MQERGIRAGSAIADITPNKPVYLGGYGAGPVRYCTEVSSPIYARALVLKEGDRAYALLIVDTQGLPYKSRRDWFGFKEIEARARSRLADLELLFGASSHSHCSPDSTGLWGGISDEYAASLIDGATSAIIEAYERAEPSEIYFGAVKTNGLLRNQVRGAPHQRVEERAFLIEARSVTGSPIGRVVIFSAHATVASGNHLSADWPGELARFLERDPGGITLVLPGSIGRTQPLARSDGSQASVRAYAARLEDQIRPHLGDLARLETEHQDRPLLGGAEIEVSLPIRNVVMFAAARAFGRTAPTTPTASSRGNARTISKAMRIGDIYLVGFPGEAYPNLQWALEQRLSELDNKARPVVCSLVGDQIGYLIYPAWTYPALAARAAWNDNALLCVAPTASERLLETSVELCRKLSGSSSVGSPGAEERSAEERSVPRFIWDAAGVPTSALAVGLTVAGAAGYALGGIVKRLTDPPRRRIERRFRAQRSSGLHEKDD